jgi:hypothetical protein
MYIAVLCWMLLHLKQHRLGSIPIVEKYLLVRASCSLGSLSEQDARTTKLKIWDAPHRLFL